MPGCVREGCYTVTVGSKLGWLHPGRPCQILDAALDGSNSGPHHWTSWLDSAKPDCTRSPVTIKNGDCWQKPTRMASDRYKWEWSTRSINRAWQQLTKVTDWDEWQWPRCRFCCWWLLFSNVIVAGRDGIFINKEHTITTKGWVSNDPPAEKSSLSVEIQVDEVEGKPHDLPNNSSTDFWRCIQEQYKIVLFIKLSIL